MKSKKFGLKRTNRRKPVKPGQRIKPMGPAYTEAIERAIEMYLKENRNQ